MTRDTEGKKLVALRIQLTPEEYDFAEFYGQEFCNGSPRDYLRMLLSQALAKEMEWERQVKARLKEEEANGRQPAPESSPYPDLDDEIPF